MRICKSTASSSLSPFDCRVEGYVPLVHKTSNPWKGSNSVRAGRGRTRTDARTHVYTRRRAHKGLIVFDPQMTSRQVKVARHSEAAEKGGESAVMNTAV